MVPESRLGTSTVRHHDVPRFGALRRDNTPTPAELYCDNNSSYNQCSVSCFRGRGSSATTLLSPASLSMGGSEVNAAVPSHRRDALGSYRMSLGYYSIYTYERAQLIC